ncbi:MAG: putative baseplate assembly protein, partial [bacterium]|nr:putative baseplate assembly protein [bacterium]
DRHIKEPGQELKFIEQKDSNTGQVKALWAVWQERENFYFSFAESRHYILDSYNGLITFGDGIKGKIPPKGGNSIMCHVYYTGGGIKGNVEPDTLTHLEESNTFSHQVTVTNPYPAHGGMDMEPLEKAKTRAPSVIMKRNRAITAEDFQYLAKAASDQVDRAFCKASKDGIIKIMVLPKSKKGDGGKPLLSPGLQNQVTDYLDLRRTINTRFEVLGPGYRDISIRTDVVLKDQTCKTQKWVHRHIRDDLKAFFHPLSGGRDKKGYPIGRTLHISEIYYIIEGIEGVDHVDRLTLIDSAGEEGKKKILFEETEFPYLKLDLDSIKIVSTGD